MNDKIIINKDDSSNKIKLDNINNSISKINIDGKSKNNNKISLAISEKKKKTSSNLRIYQIIKDNQEAEVEIQSDENQITIGFNGAKLLSLNQIFAILQLKKINQQFFQYKKTWHNIIYKVLEDYNLKLQNENKSLPYFNGKVEIFLFRMAPKFIDEDAVTIIFKFIIDALKKTKENPYGILAEDNKKIVSKIIPYTEKGDYYIAIKIKRSNETEEKMTKDKFFNL